MTAVIINRLWDVTFFSDVLLRSVNNLPNMQPGLPEGYQEIENNKTRR